MHRRAGSLGTSSHEGGECEERQMLAGQGQAQHITSDTDIG